MVSPLHVGNQADLHNDKVITAFGEMAPKPDLRPELLLRLQGKLQTTLDINQLLEIFFAELQLSVLVDGVAYTNNEQKLNVLIGRHPRHTVRYHLQTHDDAMGELVFHRSTRFREHELANLEGLLTTLVYPLRNSLRYHIALAASFRDPLTGAGNRVALDRTLSREVELTKRHNQDLSVLMLDLDHFKNVNDTYGHSIGDKVLKDVVNCISTCIRQTDLCFRYGGEEFLIMLSNAEHLGALAIAERICRSIAELRFVTDKGPMQITTSIGCASLHADDSPESLVQRADMALYQAKNNGRNRVVGETERLQLV